MFPPEARKLANKLLAEHNLTDWTFKFDRAVKRFGLCQHHTKTISLSLPLTERNSVEEVTDTLLHEIAHALVGPGYGHKQAWKEMAARVGARPERCYDGMAVKQPPGNWKVSCLTCGKVGSRVRARGKGKVACGACCRKYNGGEWSSEYVLVWDRIVLDPRKDDDGL